mgnify:FL=1
MNRHQLMNIEEFCNTFGYSQEDLNYSYKLLANFSILANSYSHDTITCDVQDSIANCNINGASFDGFAILLDGQILNSVKAIEDIFRVNDSVKSEIVIVKSVLKGLNNDIFKQYLSNIKQVFSVVLGEVDTSNCSSVVQSTDTISCLYNQCVKTSNPLPDLNLYIVADELKASDKKKIKEQLESLFKSDKESFSQINSFALDTAELLTFYSRTKIRESVEIEPYKTSIPLPSIHGIKDALITVVSFCEFKKLLIADNGSIKTSIFHDNIRAFQGKTIVSKQMGETLKQGKFDQFIAMNNGITIIVSELKHTQGGKLELVDYQIVNGCQTCHVLYNNRDLDGIGDLLLLVKIICSTDENVRNSVIMGTNSQIEVKREQLIALTGLQERIEDYYAKIRANDNGLEPLYYERRSKQYVTETKVPQNKVITIPIEIMSFGAIFLSSPHYVSGYYSQIIENLKNKGRGIFSDAYRVDSYYTSGLMFYKLSQLFGRNQIPNRYKRLKYQILYASRLVAEINYREMPPLESAEIEDYCEYLNKLFCNDVTCRKCFGTAIEIIDSVVSGTITDSIAQNKEVTDNIAKKIKELSEIKERTSSANVQEYKLQDFLRLLDSNEESYFETDSFKLAIDTLAKQVEYAENEIVIVAGRILNPYINHSKIIHNITNFLDKGKLTLVLYGSLNELTKSSLLSRLALLKTNGKNVVFKYLSIKPTITYNNQKLNFNMYAFDGKSLRVELQRSYNTGRVWLNSPDIVNKYVKEVNVCIDKNGEDIDIVRKFGY